MTKSTKIIIGIIVGVAVLCAVVTVGASLLQPESNEGAPTVAPTISVPQSTEQQTTTPEQAQQSQLKADILGSWMDSANMSGYEFFDTGAVRVTYVNLTVPVVNLPINGSANGTYTIEGNRLTIKYSIYSRTITYVFTASVSDNVLTLRDVDNGDVSTYEKRTSQSSEQSTTGSSSLVSAASKDILGSWRNSDGTVKYTFNSDGTAMVTLTASASDSFNGIFSGVYIVDSSRLTLQYTTNSGTVTQEFTVSLSGSSMSMTDAAGNVQIMVRDSEQAQTSNAGLVGKWMDSSLMSGFEFKSDGSVEVTYVNFTVPVINMPINGSFSGTYSVDGSLVTVRASIYSATVTDTYSYEISDNVLTLTNIEDGKVTTLTRQ